MNLFHKIVLKTTTPFLPKGLNNTHPNYYSLITAVLMGIIGTILNGLGVLNYYFQLHLELTSYFLLALTLGNIAAIACIKYNLPKFLTVNLACSIAFFSAIGMTLETGGTTSPNVLLLAAVPGYGFLLGGRKSTIFWFISIITFFGIFDNIITSLNIELKTVILDPEENQLLFINNFLGIIVWLIVTLFIFNQGNLLDKKEIQKQSDQIENQYEELMESSEEVNAANQQLNHQNNQIISSINYAQRIQSALLPNEEKMKVYLPETFIIYKPKDIVSGDFYWFNHIDGNSILITADCTGHGVPGAFMSIIGYQLLQEIVLMRKIIAPDKILKTLRYRLPMLLKQDSNENQDGMDISVTVINHQDNTVHFSGAKSNLAYLKDGKAHLLKGDSITIGGHSIQRKVKNNFKIHELSLNEIDSMYLFTDGFQDQFGGNENKKFLRKNILKALEEVAPLNMEEQKTELLKKLISWKGNRNQTDDILFIGIPSDKVAQFTTKHKTTMVKEPEDLVTIL
ncbi:PP2C family protein-serine/threonine phosphatase [Sediminitomix flava]|uniref:Serine phosphatase RsbU (Regulator of sigma subunit) n=1 Tax=Sediminitomix flava TaxID=379075 RepID=A0A315ZG62_SEDFL|nr:SpoIIE family protein phosphatase [Sediminitomix flava]PWJ44143.1 serine phosphatase RsbU (regulator of sigma subunit) [Sediminitomix flava]